MAIFQSSVLKKYLKQQDDTVTAKAYKKYTNYFHDAAIQQNIRESKEEQYQAKFLDELFVNVLGYTMNPQPKFNLTTEFKNIKNARKADGAILKDDQAVAVIELKGTKTKDLESIRQQAFDYKANQTGCVYVITSNFEKIRFYINNAVEFEEFDLFNLSYNRFELLYLCLQKDHLLSNLPLKIKEASIHEEEEITKKFYSDYSLFKRELFRDIVKRNLRNPELKELGEVSSKKTLFKKTQKLLDRFLFIFFGEDRGLLPPNSIPKILDDWKRLKDLDAYSPLYSRYKKYFNYLNEGWKGKEHDIFAYNGGLFKPDSVLDTIEIDDELLYKHTAILTKYDFESQVDVNILGHIFEHSLNEIESINAEIEGVEFDKQKSKRKKDGVFYTPKYITKYIVDNTIGKLCEEKKAELVILEEEYLKGPKNRAKTTIKKLDKKLEDYREWMLSLTVCDPACGSGAFLNQALEFLILEHQWMDEMYTKLHGGGLVFPDIENSILEKNIYGVDLNDESVEIAKLSLWLRTAQKGRKLTSLNNNIKCGNSLIDSKAVAGDKAFTWEDEFPEVFANGGFDVIIGNPPYVFARDNISQEEKLFYNKNYDSADYQINTYLLFIEKTISLIKDCGLYSLIVPNAWLMVYSGKGLRKFILDTCKVNEIINLEGYSFEGVNVETIILIAEKKFIEMNSFDVLLSNGKEFIASHKRNQNDFRKNEGFEFKVFADDDSRFITEKLLNGSVELDSIVQIKAGLQAYEKGKGNPKQTAEDVKNRPYDYSYEFNENTHKYLDGKDVGRYYVSWSGLYLKYGENLAAPRTFNLFSGEKIIVREITGKYPRNIIATFNDDVYLYNRSNIGIVKDDSKSISLKYVTAILNSSLMSYYFVKNTAKSVRKMFPKIILKDLRKFPFKEIPMDLQKPFIGKVDYIQNKYHDLITNSLKMTNYINSQYTSIILSRKLQSWHELDFSDFIKELNKAIKKAGGEKLSKMDEMEWMEVFEANKKEALELKAEIDRTDREIDGMVYELYGLSEEEIGIVENN